jgi:predicted lysophospholipase L1 biosynthesis ABC-type transport system permease subunit
MFAYGPHAADPATTVNAMTAPDLAFALFTMLNSARELAYPQLMRIVRKHEGAPAPSYTMWFVFALACVSTVLYAIFAVPDLRMAAIFAANLLLCLLVLSTTIYEYAHAWPGKGTSSSPTRRNWDDEN